MRLNNLFLLLISVTPFILALVFAYGPHDVTDRSESAILAVGLFGTVELITGLVLYGIWRLSTKGHRLVDPGLPDEWVEFAEVQSLRRIAVFGLSVLVGLALPLLAEFIWLGTILGRRWKPNPPPSSPPNRPGSST
ncbi:MAG: hypothetical protein L3J95_02630 [Thermoplasmata archaeon]|nr:hypothetical protein [Thermoplasmata archaeon]MCI4359303.1 hypothetical protein [Thermoplasmata archaeon]